MTGPFEAAALELHGHGLSLIPTGGDDGKTPLVGGWSAWKGQRRATVEAFARKYPDANIGVLTGLSGLTVVDADDETTLADAERLFGYSPIVTRSPRGGGHLYYKSTGERNANLRRSGLNIDIRGQGGLVLAPPSVRSGRGEYRMERGSWTELQKLPAIRPGAIPQRPERQRVERAEKIESGEGSRNVSLFTALRYHAPLCSSADELTMEAHAINAQFTPPLPRCEAEKVAGSVWRMKLEGRILLPGQQRILMLPAELEKLGADAFYFAAWIRKWHGAKGDGTFALSPKAMEKGRLLPGWGRRRYGMAIASLCLARILERVHKGGARKGDPSLYRMGARNGPNVTTGQAPAISAKQKRAA